MNFDSYRIPDDRSQERRLPGMPFGTRGGILIDYTFPQDGEYEFSAALARINIEELARSAEGVRRSGTEGQAAQ